MRNVLLALLATSSICVISGCATSSGVTIARNVAKVQYRSAYVVEHADSSRDMDALLVKALLSHGMTVKSGPDGPAPAGSDLKFKYVDDWKWDIKMYLRAYELEVYDAKTNSLIATGDWKNSVMHGYYEEDKIVPQVVDQVLSKVSTQ